MLAAITVCHVAWESAVSPELFPLCYNKVRKTKPLLKSKLFYNYKASQLLLRECIPLIM